VYFRRKKYSYKDIRRDYAQCKNAGCDAARFKNGLGLKNIPQKRTECKRFQSGHVAAKLPQAVFCQMRRGLW
jgi:hypothetical protein